jgi:hypothetical protein
MGLQPSGVALYAHFPKLLAEVANSGAYCECDGEPRISMSSVRDDAQREAGARDEPTRTAVTSVRKWPIEDVKQSIEQTMCGIPAEIAECQRILRRCIWLAGFSAAGIYYLPLKDYLF